MRVDDVVCKVLSLGRGCLLAVMDIESAFRNIPVHPHDWHIGLRWKGKSYVDTVLPKIFNALADVLQWMTEQCGTSYLRHYLDNFITAGGHHSEEECQSNMSLLTELCNLLGFSMAANKQEGPATCLIIS